MSASDVELVAALTLGAIATSPVPLLIGVVLALCILLVLVLAVRPIVRITRRAYRRRRYVTVPIVLDLRRPPAARGRHR